MKISLVPALAVLPLLPASAQEKPPAPTEADVAAALHTLQIRQYEHQLAQQDLKHRNEMAALRASLAEKETTAREAELQALQHEKEMATLQATIATQAKTEREAIFGETLKPRDGSISASSTAEMMIVAQSRLDSISQAMAGQVAKFEPKPTKVYLMAGFPPPDMQMAKSTRVLFINDVYSILNGSPSLDTLVKNLQDARSPALPPPDITFSPSMKTASLLDLGNTVQSALSLLALTRVNRTFTGTNFTPNNNAFISSMVSALKDHRIDEVQIGLEPEIPADSTNPKEAAPKPEELPLMKHLMDLDSALSKANFELAEAGKAIETLEGANKGEMAEIAKLDAKIAALDNELLILRREPDRYKDRIAAVEKEQEDAKGKILDLKQGIAGRNKTVKTLEDLKEKVERQVKRGTEHLAALEKGKIMGVEVGKMLDVEDYERSLKANRVILFVNVNDVAGTNLTKQNLLTNSFQAGAGVSVSYSAMGPGFSTVAADTIYGYKGFYRVKDRKAGEIPSHPSLDRVEVATDPSEKETESGRRRKPWGGPRSK